MGRRGNDSLLLYPSSGRVWWPSNTVAFARKARRSRASTTVTRLLSEPTKSATSRICASNPVQLLEELRRGRCKNLSSVRGRDVTHKRWDRTVSPCGTNAKRTPHQSCCDQPVWRISRGRWCRPIQQRTSQRRCASTSSCWAETRIKPATTSPAEPPMRKAVHERVPRQRSC